MSEEEDRIRNHVARTTGAFNPKQRPPGASNGAAMPTRTDTPAASRGEKDHVTDVHDAPTAPAPTLSVQLKARLADECKDLATKLESREKQDERTLDESLVSVAELLSILQGVRRLKLP